MLWDAHAGHLVLCDFACACRRGSPVTHLVQSPGFRAPEVERHFRHEARAAAESGGSGGGEEGTAALRSCAAWDMFSVGCVLQEMCGLRLGGAAGERGLLAVGARRCAAWRWREFDREAAAARAGVTAAAGAEECPACYGARHQQYARLVWGLMRPRAAERLTARDALRHEALALLRGEERACTERRLSVLPTRQLLLLHMARALGGVREEEQEEQEMEELQDLLDDVRELCESVGEVGAVWAEEGHVCVRFANSARCAEARAMLSRRSYSGVALIAVFRLPEVNT